MSTPAVHNRLRSLDVFRGATIAAMILVNNPVDWDYAYSQLRHATWNGWTFTDMIFPFFLFIIGVSITLSLESRKKIGNSNARLMLRIAKRAVVLFVLGIALTNFPRFDLSNFRIPGVLQRIALCYLFAALIYLQSGFRGQVCWTIGLLTGYWMMLVIIPVPGVGAGVLEPGKSLPTYIDSVILGNHLWSNYIPWDPEGIGSTIPAIASTLFGVLAGHCLRSPSSMEMKTFRMLTSGLLLLLLGWTFSFWLPINKGLWTSSYSVFMAGWALICFAVLYWLVDVQGHDRWSQPFAIYGKNALAAYILSVVLDGLLTQIRVRAPTGRSVRLKMFIFDHFFRVTGPKGDSLLYSITFVLVIFFIVWALYRKRVFLKI
ncbi:MAG: acyltransferase family protein [Syntrophobacteraceae bacterium]